MNQPERETTSASYVFGAKETHLLFLFFPKKKRTKKTHHDLRGARMDEE